MDLKCFVYLIVTVLTQAQKVRSFTGVTNKCEFYNSTCAEQPDSCDKVVECEPPGENKRNHCFVLWKIYPNRTQSVTLKGCFLNNVQCYDKTSCVETAEYPNKDILFCCCEGDLCNGNFTWNPTPTEPPPSSTAVPPGIAPIPFYYLIGMGVVLALLITFIAVGFRLWTKKYNIYFSGLPTSDPHPVTPPSPQLDNRPIQLIEVKARGRFGAVWKAKFKSEEVAVKIFPVQDKQSWLTEQEIFKLPYMDHPNILSYIGVEKKGDTITNEFWLITAYHERGSLCDYLKANTLTWNELCRISETMTRGLAHLHDHIVGSSPNEPLKPSVAHRDFKSKNVLLKSDLTACIADFGLALTFESGKSCGDTHGQVGTRRYMAPEVLEGAINFTSDSFLKIDMYACGLVLWELVSRCKAQDGPIAEYRLPFEEWVGTHPSLEDMQEHVVQKKHRPVIEQHWRNHLGMAALCDTMEECWDHDAEARLSASCVLERIICLKSSQHNGGNVISWRIENDSFISPDMSIS